MRNSHHQICFNKSLNFISNKTQYLRLRLYDSDFNVLIALWMLSYRSLSALLPKAFARYLDTHHDCDTLSSCRSQKYVCLEMRMQPKRWCLMMSPWDDSHTRHGTFSVGNYNRAVSPHFLQNKVVKLGFILLWSLHLNERR